MVKLSQSFNTVYDHLYFNHEAFFPLIASVLLGTQKGLVFVDHVSSLRCAYVEHHFGFAQVFGTPDSLFNKDLYSYLLENKSFSIPKIRLYTPQEPGFLRSSKLDNIRSERQRFFLDTNSSQFADARKKLQSCPIEIKAVDHSQLKAIDAKFNVVTRFWCDDEDFISHGYAVAAWIDGQPVALCYAAAVANGQAEIDVMTLPEFRLGGLGKLVVQSFNERCLDRGLRPVWDCFTNNIGSMSLCQAVGFKPARPPYPFYTFNK